MIKSTATTRRTIHDGISTVLELLTVSHKEKWAVRCNFYRNSVVNVRCVYPPHPLAHTPAQDDGTTRAAGHREVCLVRFPQVVTPHVFLVQWCAPYCLAIQQPRSFPLVSLPCDVSSQQGAACDGVPRHRRVFAG